MRISLIALLTLSACAHTGERDNSVEVVKYVDRMVPVPTPCDSAVTRPAFPMAGAVSPEVEGAVETLISDDRALRQYIADLEGAALMCGVKIEY